MRARRLHGFGLLLLVALGFLLRLAPLGRYVTPDEPAWVERSIRFADALMSRDLDAVPSTGHPGVTTMWLGGAGVAVRRWLNPTESADHLDWIRRLAWLAPENGEAFRHLEFLLPYGRVAVALTTSLGLLATYWMLRHLFDRAVAFLTAGLLAFDPFLVGHSGLLHTDGLLATFSTLSVLSLLLTVRDGRGAGRWSLVSGVTAGLALLTKSLGAYLVIFAAVILGLSWLSGSTELLQTLRWSFLWGLAVTVVYVGLYPAMWVAPLDTLRDLLVAPTYQSTTALMPTFFAGQMALQHGPAFYLVALPFRLSPIVLVGSLLSFATFSRKRELRPVLAWLGVFCIGFLLLLALNVKRYQRYLLPSFGPLTVLAALALSDLWRSRCWNRLLDLSALVLLQFLLLLPFAAYPLTSFNLLLGGPWVGTRLLSADWGEGMGSAARWLNQQPDAERLTVAASSVPPFASLFDGKTVPMERAYMADYIVRGAIHEPRSSVEHPIAYTATIGLVDHTVVLTNTMWLEQADYLADHADPGDLILVDLDTPLLRQYQGPGTVHSMAPFPDEAAVADWLEQQAPGRGPPESASIWLVSSRVEDDLEGSFITAAHVRRQLEAIASPLDPVAVGGATITAYDHHSSPAPDRPSPHQAAFAGQLALIDSALPEMVAWPDDLHVVLRWRALGQPLTDYRASVALRDEQEHTWSQTEMMVINAVYFPTSSWQISEWSDATYNLSLPPTIPPGCYTVEVSLYHGDTGARLGATGPDGHFRGTRVPIGEVDIAPPERSPTIDALKMPQHLGTPPRTSAGPLTLLGFKPSSGEVLSGDTASFALFWQADAAPEVNYRVGLRLVTPADEIGLERVHALSPFSTSRWHAGHRFQSRYDLRIPPDLPPGHYRLTVGVLDPTGQTLSEDPVFVAPLEVLPRERSFEMPDEGQDRLVLAFGEHIHLRGYGVATTEVEPGKALPLTLYWQAEGPTARTYTLFVHLLGPEGRLYGQVDSIPGNGEAPTTSWARGQVIVEDISLPVASDAPAGTYHIVVGFYDAAYGDRLAVKDASGHSLAEDQGILPVDIVISGGSS